MWLNFFNFDLKIIRQGSVSIICKKNLKILTLSMLKHAEMVCQKSADPGSPRVKGGPFSVNQPVTDLTSGLESYFGLY